jgi:hypothetical protein
MIGSMRMGYYRHCECVVEKVTDTKQLILGKCGLIENSSGSLKLSIKREVV